MTFPNSILSMRTPGVESLMVATALAALALVPSHAAEQSQPLGANELAARLDAARKDGSSYVRLRMEIKGEAKETLQLQIKERRTSDSTDVVYQVLYPKERKGESVLLQKQGKLAARGSVFVPPDTVRPIEDPKESLLGSDLACEDVVDNFFAWEQQALAGVEELNGVKCSILESKPTKGEHSIYDSVKSWIDVRRLVPLRIEKYKSGKLLRRIDTTRVVSDAGRQIPADLTVTGVRPGSSTLLDGSRIRHDVTYTDRDFTVEGLKELSTPRSSSK